MNRCKNCGKEIPDNSIFCCRSCSAKYNNSRRVRKPWTEEQKEKFQNRGKQVCKYCGKETGHVVISSRISEGVCKDCNKFRHTGLYRKLGLVEGPLRNRYIQSFQILQKAYFEDELSVQEIFEKFGVCHTTLKRLFNENGCFLRTVSEGLRKGVEKGTVVPGLGKTGYITGVHTSWEGNKVNYRSFYELAYAKDLDRQKIPYRHEPFRIRYFDTKLGKERVAIPDFYLPDTNELVEIKSNWTIEGRYQELKDKFKAYRQEGYVPVLLLEGQKISIE